MASYVVLDGIDGSGKDSQADLLVRHFRCANNESAIKVNEPDNESPTGKLLREMLKEGTYPEAHAAMFLADRMILQTRTVKPALEAGVHVVSSRSFLSTLVYQQDHHPLQWLLDIHRALPVKPTHIFFLDIDPEEAATRLNRRNSAKEHYEQIDIQRRNRQRYLDLASSGVLQSFVATGGVVSVVNGNGTVQETHECIKGLFPPRGV